MNLEDYWAAAATTNEKDKMIHCLFVMNQHLPDPLFFDALSKYVAPHSPDLTHAKLCQRERQRTQNFSLDQQHPFLICREHKLKQNKNDFSDDSSSSWFNSNSSSLSEYEKGKWIEYLWRIRSKHMPLFSFYVGCSSMLILCLPVMCVFGLCAISLPNVQQYQHIILVFLSFWGFYIACVLVYNLCNEHFLYGGNYFGIENNIFVAVNMRHIFYARQYASLPLRHHKKKRSASTKEQKQKQENEQRLLSIHKFKLRYTQQTLNVGTFYLPTKKEMHVLNSCEVLQAFKRNAFLLCQSREKLQQCQILVCLNPFDFDVDELVSFLKNDGHHVVVVKCRHPVRAQSKINIVFAISGNFDNVAVQDKSDMLALNHDDDHEQFLVCLQLSISCSFAQSESAAAMHAGSGGVINQVIVHGHELSEPDYCDV